jgi:fibronectin type 3 domain-containing protein
MNKKLLKKKRKKLREKLNRRVVGYHLYRSDNENLPFMFWARLTDEPIPEGSFNDPAAEHGKRYYYKLTEVYENGEESKPKTANASFTDHAGNTFEQNPLEDFAGYNMYRSADRAVPLDQWEKRNTEPIPTTEYKDEGVESGEVYFYYVRAVDSKGNESAPGEIMRVVRK